jgi:hypothetical protein
MRGRIPVSDSGGRDAACRISSGKDYVYGERRNSSSTSLEWMKLSEHIFFYTNNYVADNCVQLIQ